jgi:hypothetical protein
MMAPLAQKDDGAFGCSLVLTTQDDKTPEISKGDMVQVRLLVNIFQHLG